MSVIKKASPQTQPRSKRPRAAHSQFLKRFHGETGPAVLSASAEAVVNAAPAEHALLESAPGVEPSLRMLTRTRTSLVLTQTLVARRGAGQTLLNVELKLSTAQRGSRKADGLTESAYLFRLEMVKTSPGIQLEGFSLGPWRAESLDLEGGSIFVAEPLWTGFAPLTGKVRGRIRFADTVRQCVLDLPWNTEALVPGPEPW